MKDVSAIEETANHCYKTIIFIKKSTIKVGQVKNKPS